jgi:AcrR family transcriptional regulator
MVAIRSPKQDRSKKTRLRLLEATIETLVERGFSGASTPAIAERAGVSRGALQNLFPAKIDLLCAAIEHLMDRRLNEVSSRLLRGGPPTVGEMVELLWDIYTGDAFYAWNELCTAARTDEPLRAKLAEVNAGFYASTIEVLRALFPDLDDRRLTGAVRYLTSLMNGLALNRVLDDDDAASEAALELLHVGVAAFQLRQGDFPK